jgi:hypothetical protein
VAIIESPDGSGCLARWPVLGGAKPDLLPLCNLYSFFNANDNLGVVEALRAVFPGSPVPYVRDLVFEEGEFDLTRLGAPFRFRAITSARAARPPAPGFMRAGARRGSWQRAVRRCLHAITEVSGTEHQSALLVVVLSGFHGLRAGIRRGRLPLFRSAGLLSAGPRVLALGRRGKHAPLAETQAVGLQPESGSAPRMRECRLPPSGPGTAPLACGRIRGPCHAATTSWLGRCTDA